METNDPLRRQEDNSKEYSAPGKDRRKSTSIDVLSAHLSNIGSELTRFRKSKGRSMLFKSGAILLVTAVVAIQPMFKDRVGHIAMINIDGAITKGSPTGDGNLLSETFEKAVKNKAAKAIVIHANSPGGSPVQAEIFYKTLMEYRKKGAEATDEEKKVIKPVVVTVGDLCASACVYMVSGADTIYAHSSSIVGSIGVKIESWGFTGLMDKVGIQRRVMHKGEHKNMLSPYHEPDNEALAAIDQSIMTPSYEAFKTSVVEGRRKPQMYNDPELFSGLIWGGDQAVEKGLVDEIKTSHQLITALREEYDVNKTIQYNSVATQDILSKLLKGSIDYGVKSWFNAVDEKSTMKLTF
jgi:protease-4